jgi:hypothetical protein
VSARRRERQAGKRVAFDVLLTPDSIRLADAHLDADVATEGGEIRVQDGPSRRRIAPGHERAGVVDEQSSHDAAEVTGLP